MSNTESRYDTFTVERATPTIGASTTDSIFVKRLRHPAATNYARHSCSTRCCSSAISASARRISCDLPGCSVTPRK